MHPVHRGGTFLRGEAVRGVDPHMRLVAMQSAAKDLGLWPERGDIDVIDNVMSRRCYVVKKCGRMCFRINVERKEIEWKRGGQTKGNRRGAVRDHLSVMATE